jgi:hypothetical protein
MKQIQKIIKTLRYSEGVVNKKNNINETRKYLENNRRQYVASAPVGFKSRSGSDFFLQ